MGYQPDIINDIIKKLTIKELKRITKLTPEDIKKINECIEDRINQLEIKERNIKDSDKLFEKCMSNEPITKEYLNSLDLSDSIYIEK